MPDEPAEEVAILAAAPLRHLRSALEVCAERGRVALPATGRGDLDLARAGEPVYLYAYQVGDRPIPAATWRATFVRAVDAIGGDHPEPEITPATWRADRVATEPATGLTATDAVGVGDAAFAGPSAAASDPVRDEHDALDDVDELAGAGPPELFLEVTALHELAKREWLFTNELVRKGDRGARTFVPLAPVRVLLPD